MTKPNENLSARARRRPARRGGLLALLPLALIAVAFAATISATAASAQDPGSDQYSPEPTQPGNDSSPDIDVSPVPAVGTDAGGPPSGDPAGSSGVPAAPPTEADDSGTTGAGGEGERRGNADERTLDGLAASAEQQRSERNGGAEPVAQLSDDGSDGGSAGIGAFVWIALAAIVAWAIGAGIVNYRRRDGDRTSESSRSSGEQRTA